MGTKKRAVGGGDLRPSMLEEDRWGPVSCRWDEHADNNYTSKPKQVKAFSPFFSFFFQIAVEPTMLALCMW